VSNVGYNSSYTSVGSQIPPETATNLSRRPLHFSSAFILSSFFLLLHLDIFCLPVAFSKNYHQILQPLRIIIWHKILTFGLNIICYKMLWFGINICYYLIGSFQKFLEDILTHNFFMYRSWFEAFLCLLIRDGGGAPLKARYLYYSCCWRPLRKKVTHTLKLLLGALESRALTHYSWFWGPFNEFQKQSTYAFQ